MGMGGPPAGSPFSAPNGGSGLPFGGIPAEMQERVGRLLAHEPHHEEPVVEFAAVDPDQRPFTLVNFLRPHKKPITVALGLVVVETLASQAGPFLTQLGIDNGIRAKSLPTLWTVTLIYVGTVVLATVIGTVRLRFTGRFSEALMESLRVRVFSHLQRLSIDYFTEEKSGRILTRMTSDIEALNVLFQEGLLSLAVQGLSLLVVTVMLLRINVGLAFLVIGIILPTMLALTWWFRSASERGNAVVRDRIADVMADLSESLAGIRIVTAFNRRRHNIVNHQNVLGDYRAASLHVARIGAAYAPGAEFVGIIGQAVVLAVGGRMVIRGQLTLGEFTALVLYLGNFFAPIQQLVQLYTTYQQGQAAVAKLRDLLAISPSVPESHDAVELPPISGAIMLDDVTFGYQPDRPVLHNLTLNIAPGEVVAFVGATGAGKSTIAKLVTRFYDVTSGSITVDGFDVRDVTFESLRRQLGVVPQEPFLFAGSIRDNLSFGRRNVSEGDLNDAVDAVGLRDLLNRLPDGLDAPCHERGSSLSAGERQLLALARAFLSRPRVLILDEATSNLDLASESLIEKALDVVLAGRTAIVIAHRLATAMRADRIAVIDVGRLVELGTHTELVRLGGKYAAMYATYVQHTQPAPGINELSPQGQF